MGKCHTRKKCHYYKCNIHMNLDEMKKLGVTLFRVPHSKRRLTRLKKFLLRMNIASYEYKIPEVKDLRICSRHFKEEDMLDHRDGKKLSSRALPIDWKDIFPKEEFELFEARTSFRPGDNILEYIEEQREYKDGKPRIEHDYSQELDPNVIPSFVTRTEVELVRYVRPNTTGEGNLLLLSSTKEPKQKQQLTSKNFNSAMDSWATSQPPVDEKVDDDVRDFYDGTDWDHADDNWNDEMVIPKEKVCRTCGQEEENLVGIYKSRGRSIFLADKINSILPIKITEEDKLPLQVCLGCIDQIEAACKLFTKVSDVHQTLKKWYRVSDEVDVLKTIMDDVGIGPDDDFDTGADHHISDDEDIEQCHDVEDVEPIQPYINVAEVVNDVDSVSNVEAYGNALKASKDPLSEPHYKQLLCSSCDIVFGKTEEYVEHNKLIHKRVLLHCPLCFVFFNSMKLLQEHWKCLHAKILRELNIVAENEILQKLQTTNRKKKTQWQCNYCDDIFDDNIAYKDHLKIEWKKQRALRPSKVVVGTIKCDYCDEMLVTESKKVHHMLSAHKEYTPYECSYCHKRYKNKLCWREHESTHVGETNFLCNICGKVSKTRTLLRTHLRTHQKPIPCKVCSRLVNPDRMRAHVRCHAEHIRGFECKLCDKTFRCFSALWRHKFKHAGVRFPCDMCNATSPNPDKLKEHKKIVHGFPQKIITPKIKRKPFSNNGDDGFECAVEGCGSYYAEEKELYRHCNQAHGGSKMPHRYIEPGTDGFLCSYCNEIFGQPDSYKTHMAKKKHAEKPFFTCRVCLFNTQKLNELMKHLETHSECLRYTCQECPKKFSTAFRRNVHEFLHIKNPKECPHCRKTIKGLVFQDHLNYHTGEKPYGCSICGQMFSSKKIWTSHLATHSNSTPYTCEICDRSFRTQHKLKVHKRVHTAKKVYHCKLCDFASLSKKTRQFHIVREHTLINDGVDLDMEEEQPSLHIS